MKGATEIEKYKQEIIAISIHAPVKGATYGGLMRLVKPYNFNPRPREGSDGIVTQIAYTYQ